MTGEQFLEYLGTAKYTNAAGKSRQNLIRSRYDAYLKAYNVKTFKEAFNMSVWCGPNVAALSHGFADKDAGRPAVTLEDEHAEG